MWRRQAAVKMLLRVWRQSLWWFTQKAGSSMAVSNFALSVIDATVTPQPWRVFVSSGECAPLRSESVQNNFSSSSLQRLRSLLHKNQKAEQHEFEKVLTLERSDKEWFFGHPSTWTDWLQEETGQKSIQPSATATTLQPDLASQTTGCLVWVCWASTLCASVDDDLGFKVLWSQRTWLQRWQDDNTCKASQPLRTEKANPTALTLNRVRGTQTRSTHVSEKRIMRCVIKLQLWVLHLILVYLEKN